MSHWSWLLSGVVAFVASNVDELLVSVMQFAQAEATAAAAAHTQSDSESDRHCHQESQPNENTPLQPTQVATESNSDALRVHHVVLGQLVGFTLIVLVSLCGYALGHFLQRPWIGLLGLLPIVLGVKELAHEGRKALCPRPRRTLQQPAVTAESGAATAYHVRDVDEISPDEPHAALHRPSAASSFVLSSLREAPSSRSSARVSSCCSPHTLQVASVAFASGSDSIGQCTRLASFIRNVFQIRCRTSPRFAMC